VQLTALNRQEFEANSFQMSGLGGKRYPPPLLREKGPFQYPAPYGIFTFGVEASAKFGAVFALRETARGRSMRIAVKSKLP
jgi:hypothetical protein